MNVVSRTGYRVALATDLIGRKRALALRQRCFRASDPAIDDSDALDPLCRHLLVEDIATGEVVACCRLLVLCDGGEVAKSYSAQHYDLSALAAYPGAMMEVGRFCIEPARHDPDILRLAWAALTWLVDRDRIDLMFGCSSLAGASFARHGAALARLARDHTGPERWAPGRKAPEILDLAKMAGPTVDLDQPAGLLPPLLRSYIEMGGWVSDHAVIDRDLDTIHVFTALEIAAIPAARARALRMMAAKIATAALSGD